MTYMREIPEFKRHFPAVNASDHNKWYGLFQYTEGGRDAKLRGVPVLFVPGNSGSYKQVRSLASVSHQMSLKIDRGRESFDYFTMDLNEELSALSAAIIRRQAEYALACLSYITSLYVDGRKVLIIGHSMGGLVAKVMVGKAPDKVTMVVGLASPLEIPLVGLDEGIVDLYREVNDVWDNSERMRDIILISLTGGNRDVLVWDGHGRVSSHKYSLWLPSFSVSSVWASTDHLCIAWCRELVIVINKALFSSLASGHSVAPQTIFSTMRENLQPRLPSGRATNISVSNYFSLLIRPVVIFLAPGNAQLKTLSLPALSSAARPIRLKVVPRDCQSASVTLAVLVSPHSGHQHKYRLQREAVMLTVADAHTEQGASLVQLALEADCGYTVMVHASVADWVAQLLRIHSCRLPAFISATSILRHTHGARLGPLSPVLLLATVWLAPKSGLPNDLAWMYPYTMIDLADVAVLLFLSLAFERTISAVTSLLTFSSSLLPALPLALAASTLLPALALLSATCPPLAYLFLLLLHLLTVSRPNLDRGLARATSLTTALFLTLLIKMPALFAEYHSQIQHQDLRNVLSGTLSSLADLDSYSSPPVTLLIAIVSVSLKVTQTPMGAPPTIVSTSLWLTTVALASCCILFGAVNSSLCCSYLVCATFLSELCTCLSTVIIKR